MTQSAMSQAQGCTFCAIAHHQDEASVVHEDQTVVAFTDRCSVTPGHLLVVPRRHAVGLEDLEEATGVHVWSVAHDPARALRRSTLRCEGINLLLRDGEVAFQTVFHVHLHALPRYSGDGWSITPKTLERGRSLLDSDARAIRAATRHRADD